MPTSADFISLPFDEAIEFFKGKVNLPTKTWKDLWQGMHSRAFVVAGAMKDDLLTDFHSAITKALEKGTTIQEFRKDFDKIVEKHGWDYKGGRDWRTGVIFNTNIRTAYAAGQHKAMTDPDVLKARPYWRYVASSSREPRQEHKQWYNLVLPHDHEFWKTHRPPNGWGCKCGLVSHDADEVEEIRREEADGPHPVKTEAPKIETYEWTDKKTGEIRQIPKGIDPGWDYNVGDAAWGRRLSDDVMAEWKAQGSKAWERLTPGNWETAGRPAEIPKDTPAAKMGDRLKSTTAAATAIKRILGADGKVFTFASEGFRYDVLVDAESLAKHMEDLGRTPYLPFLPETLENPCEVWQVFERHKGTGEVVFRQRFIKALDIGKERTILMTAQLRKGVVEAWTMIPTSNMNYIDKQRVGKLLVGR